MSNKYINKYKIYKKYEEDIWGFFASKEELYNDYIEQLILNEENYKYNDLKYSKFWFLLHMHLEEKDENLENNEAEILNLNKENIDEKNKLNSESEEKEKIKDQDNNIIKTIEIEELKLINSQKDDNDNKNNQIDQENKEEEFENINLNNLVISLFNNLARKKQKKTIYGLDLENKQKLKAYYSNLKKKQLKKICIKSQKLIGNIYNNLAFFLERRVDAILLRSNLFASIYNIRQFINHNNVFVNFKLINSQNHELKIGDIISIKKNYKNLLQINLLKKLYAHQIFINYPLYLEINYELCFIALIAKPLWKSIPYKIAIDPSTILSFNLK